MQTPQKRLPPGPRYPAQAAPARLCNARSRCTPTHAARTIRDRARLDLTIHINWPYWLRKVAHYDPLRKLFEPRDAAFNRFSQKREWESKSARVSTARVLWSKSSTDIALTMEKLAMKMQKRWVLKAGAATAALAMTGFALAQQKTVTFANQDMLVPLRLVIRRSGKGDGLQDQLAHVLGRRRRDTGDGLGRRADGRGAPAR
jgi:uncharacterized protein YeaO (DUF488 family)